MPGGCCTLLPSANCRLRTVIGTGEIAALVTTKSWSFYPPSPSRSAPKHGTITQRVVQPRKALGLPPRAAPSISSSAPGWPPSGAAECYRHGCTARHDQRTALLHAPAKWPSASILSRVRHQRRWSVRTRGPLEGNGCLNEGAA